MSSGLCVPLARNTDAMLAQIRWHGSPARRSSMRSNRRAAYSTWYMCDARYAWPTWPPSLALLAHCQAQDAACPPSSACSRARLRHGTQACPSGPANHRCA
eukprot:8252651-Lingulodinium_polyedra.AAC.1